jgi:hypothetical protein
MPDQAAGLSGPLRRPDLTWTTLSALAGRRASEEGWPSPGGSARFRRRPNLRAGAELVAAFLAPVTIGLVALSVGWTSYGGVLAGTGPTARADARILGTPEGFIPVITADDLPISFVAADGRQVTTLVAVRELPDPRPATIAVDYSLAHPVRVRAVDHAGHQLGAITSTLAITAVLAALGWLGTPALRRRVLLRRALASGPTHRARYVLFLDPEGVLAMLLFPDSRADARPAWILAVDARARRLIPPSGVVMLHGRLEDDEPVAATVEGGPLPVLGRLTYAHAELVLDVLNSLSLDDESGRL